MSCYVKILQAFLDWIIPKRKYHLDEILSFIAPGIVTLPKWNLMKSTGTWSTWLKIEHHDISTIHGWQVDMVLLYFKPMKTVLKCHVYLSHVKTTLSTMKILKKNPQYFV